MNISCFARKFNVSSVTIRHYEKLGLISPQRQSNGYRYYDQHCENQMHFIINTKRIGFSLNEIRELLSLSISDLSSQEIKTIVEQKRQEIETKQSLLSKLNQQLITLSNRCDGSQPIANCPILQYFYTPQEDNTK